MEDTIQEHQEKDHWSDMVTSEFVHEGTLRTLEKQKWRKWEEIAEMNFYQSLLQNRKSTLMRTILKVIADSTQPIFSVIPIINNDIVLIKIIAHTGKCSDITCSDRLDLTG